jgi:hypothetical protein
MRRIFLSTILLTSVALTGCMEGMHRSGYHSGNTVSSNSSYRQAGPMMARYPAQPSVNGYSTEGDEAGGYNSSMNGYSS